MSTHPSRIDGDFASAAMLRLLRQGLLDLGLPCEPLTPIAREARVSLSGKRAVLAHAVSVGGLACLPLLGQGLHSFAHEPTHSALAAARDAADLLVRWGRLERYMHARHRLRTLSQGDKDVVLMHVALSPHPAPLPAEDLVVLGVVLAFLQACGHQHVQASVDGHAAFPRPDAAGLERACASGRSARWQIAWETCLPRCQTGPSMAAHLCQSEPGEPWPDWVKQAYAVLASNLTAPPDLDALAQVLGLSRRSLQRGLRQHGLGYRHMLADARYSQAGRYLMSSRITLAEIGFLCGYADQSHFTREFRQRCGLTPADYRREFAAS